ncbi:TetR/AcrR family transcriptional regulator [Clostridium sp. D2Q-14]|uniref:TetR/AcrR family transcriptional regulator n=1 Tax=Anaeromonas gelatinilytica TaxID=2683194 RepID=UPI00193C3095|nr:TetR/AcrR family transcriptional regulator [Anaeromonas gelatinilytica]MBS4535080.1 TetR/AcrR family transcriptional regulator [Anaeromonas gelatinilytica]
MQVKKDEIRQSILKEAEKEFLEKGYQNASIRKIVKLAGTTIGNFYNYFENKGALFKLLVEKEYRNFQFFMENHEKIERPDFLWNISDVSQWRKVLGELIIRMMPSFSDGFVLLIECSAGTPYENTRLEAINLMKEHFIDHMERFNPASKDPLLAEIISEQLLSGLITILKKHKDEKTRKRLITELFLFYFIGAMGLIGKW